MYKSNPCPLDGGMIGVSLANLVAELLIEERLTLPKLYPCPPAVTTAEIIWPLVFVWTLTLPPTPSPKTSNSTGDDKNEYPSPCSSIETTLIWLLLIEESPLSLTTLISFSELVDHWLGTATYSVESNLTISAGGTVNRYFHR